MTHYEYSVSGSEARYGFKSHIGARAFDAGLSVLAESAAEDYHYRGNGLDSSWPLTFTLYHDGNEIGRFEVEREAVPNFIAKKKPLEKGSG